MGCDIHPYLEIKHKGKWIYAGQPAGERNYLLFGRLSGVRGDDERYFPELYGELDQYEFTDDVLKEWTSWGNDGHSHTLITYEQMLEWIEEEGLDENITWDDLTQAEKQHGEEARYKLSRKCMYFARSWLKVMRTLIDSGVAEDARIIAWYDN